MQKLPQHQQPNQSRQEEVQPSQRTNFTLALAEPPSLGILVDTRDQLELLESKLRNIEWSKSSRGKRSMKIATRLGLLQRPSGMMVRETPEEGH